MRRTVLKAGCSASLLAWIGLACSPTAGSEEILRQIPLDHLDGVITKSGVGIDLETTTDGRGSLRIDAAEPTTVRIAEIENPSVENARLIYRARIRTDGLQGRAYLEMWCAFPGQGEFFSRALHAPLSGTNDWTTQETPFLLQKGQDPSRVKLNVVVDGEGTVWVDEAVLAKGSL